MKISNRQVRQAVEEFKIFSNNNGTLFSEWHGDLYFVFSYGHHWPLFIYNNVKKQWYANKNKYSVTTSKHYSQACPFHPDYHKVIYLSCAEMREMY